MSDEVMQSILRADSVIIPFELFNGSQEVSSLIMQKGDTFESFNFIEDDSGPMGPIDIQKSGISSEEIKNLLLSGQIFLLQER